MAPRRWFLAIGLLLLAAIACSLTPSAVPTETAPPVIPTDLPLPATTSPPSLPPPPTITETAILPTPTLTPDTPLPPSTEAPLPSPTDSPTPADFAGQHRVLRNETLSCIGRGYGVLPKAIADTNGISLTSVLHVGQVLKIPYVQWTNIPAGPVCPPQFPPPYPALPVTTPNQPTLQVPDTNTPTNPPFPATATLEKPKTPTPTFPPGATGLPPGTPIGTP